MRAFLLALWHAWNRPPLVYIIALSVIFWLLGIAACVTMPPH